MKKTEHISERIANDILIGRLVCNFRGIQINRKDKDLIDDTGGSSKITREPHQKPGRDDVRVRYRTKTKTPDERDTDVDTDKDMKKAGIPSFGGFFIPPTYAERVRSCLIHILMDERHISEKAFAAVDAVVDESKGIVQSNLDLVSQFDGNARPELCAEILYGVIVASDRCDKNSIKSSISRVGSIATLANGILSRFPQTLKALVQREG